MTTTDLNRLGGYASVVLGGAIFGIFYGWVCTVMWGLDDTDPRVAIEAMQAMNASVRNAMFFPVFFLTPVVMGLTAIGARLGGRRRAALLFGAGAVAYFLGAFLLTATANVPMNQELADTAVPQSLDEARRIWDDYSGTWQLYNAIRTFFSGVSLVLATAGLVALGRSNQETTGPGEEPQLRLSTNVS